MTGRVRWLFFAGVMVAALTTARPALAGPPLLCFPFDIGAARSLPIGQGSWRAIDPRYDVSHLVDDTLALLAPQTPVHEKKSGSPFRDFGVRAFVAIRS